MTIFTFGGTPADVLTDTAGNVVPDYAVLVRVAGTGATITAFLEEDGTTPFSQLRSNASGSPTPGAIRTFKIDGTSEIEYAYNDGLGGEVTWYQPARELAAAAYAGLAAVPPLAGSGDAPPSVAGSSAAGVSGSAARADHTHRGVTSVNGTDGDVVIGTSGAVDVTSAPYNATGDGVTNDAPAIQAALTAVSAAGGGWIVVPAGTYRLATLPLRIYRNTRLTLLPGATFERAAGATMLLNGDAAQSFGGYTGHSDILIEGGVWDMQAAGLTTPYMCMSFGHAERITVRDVEIKDVPGYHAIELNSVKTGRVIDSRFFGFVDTGSRDFSEAIQLDLAKGSAYFGGFGPYDNTVCQDIEIRGCSFGASGTAGTAAWPRGIGSHSATIDVYHSRIRILGNSFDGLSQYAVGGYAWNEVTVAGNTLQGCGAGVWIRTVDTADTNDTKDTTGTQTSASQDLRDVAVTGNVIRAGGGVNEPILLQGEATGKVLNASVTGNVIETTTSSQNGIRAEYAEQYTIGSNLIRGVAGTGISQQHIVGGVVAGNRVYSPTSSGISCDTGTGMHITGNSVHLAGVNGVHLLGGSEISVTGNQLRGSSRTTNAAAYGIRVSTSTAGILLAGNRIRNETSGNKAAYGISITNTCTGVTRYGNDLEDSGTTGPLDDQSTGAETTPFDNQGNLEDLMRPAGRYETTSRLRCGATSTAAVSGTLYLVPIWLPKGVTVSNISFMNGATAAGTPTNWWFTLHDRSRVALARTADQTTAAWAANTVKTLAVAQTTAGTASTYATTYSGLHYLGLMVKATTVPNFVGEGSMSTGSGSSPGFGDTNTGQTTPPTVTAGAFTAAAFGGNVGLLAYGYVA